MPCARKGSLVPRPHPRLPGRVYAPNDMHLITESTVLCDWNFGNRTMHYTHSEMHVLQRCVFPHQYVAIMCNLKGYYFSILAMTLLKHMQAGALVGVSTCLAFAMYQESLHSHKQL